MCVWMRGNGCHSLLIIKSYELEGRKSWSIAHSSVITDSQSYLNCTSGKKKKTTLLHFDIFLHFFYIPFHCSPHVLVCVLSLKTCKRCFEKKCAYVGEKIEVPNEMFWKGKTYVLSHYRLCIYRILEDLFLEVCHLSEICPRRCHLLISPHCSSRRFSLKVWNRRWGWGRNTNSADMAFWFETYCLPCG